MDNLYIECSSSEEFDSLGASKEGKDFFGQAYADASIYLYVIKIILDEITGKRNLPAAGGK